MSTAGISNIKVIEEPAQEPVDLQEIYDLLRLDAFGSPPTHPHDDMLRNMIRASREWTENYTKRVLVSQRIKLVLRRFSRHKVLVSDRFYDEDAYEFRSGPLELPCPPLISLDSIEYYDENNTLQLLDPANYFVSTESMLATVRMVNEQVWPVTYARDDAVQITYTAGYAPAGSPPTDLVANIPQSIKQAVLIGVQLQYDDVSPETRTALENLRRSLLGSYRVYSF